MANTYQLIASNTVGSGGAPSVIFSSIPSTYTDLKIVWSARDSNSSSTNSALISFNGTSSNLSSKWLMGNGSSASSGNSSTVIYGGEIPAGTSTANTFSNNEFYIPNYTSSTNKSISVDAVGESNASTNVFALLTAGLYSNSAQITSVTISTGSSFVQYSTFYLYGISNS